MTFWRPDHNTLPANPLNFKLDRGRSGFDTPHRFVVNYIYQFPDFMKDHGVYNRILGVGRSLESRPLCQEFPSPC